jgi:hypothetical protein
MSGSARIDDLKRKFQENPGRHFAALANEYRRTGDLDRAIELCREHLREQPRHLSGNVVLAKALFARGDRDGARGAFEAALVADPDNLDALHQLALLARDEGQGVLALDYARRALAVDPQDPELLAMAADLSAPPDEDVAPPSFDPRAMFEDLPSETPPPPQATTMLSQSRAVDELLRDLPADQTPPRAPAPEQPAAPAPSAADAPADVREVQAAAAERDVTDEQMSVPVEAGTAGEQPRASDEGETSEDQSPAHVAGMGASEGPAAAEAHAPEAPPGDVSEVWDGPPPDDLEIPDDMISDWPGAAVAGPDSAAEVPESATSARGATTDVGFASEDPGTPADELATDVPEPQAIETSSDVPAGAEPQIAEQVADMSAVEPAESAPGDSHAPVFEDAPVSEPEPAAADAESSGAEPAGAQEFESFEFTPPERSPKTTPHGDALLPPHEPDETLEASPVVEPADEAVAQADAQGRPTPSSGGQVDWPDLDWPSDAGTGEAAADLVAESSPPGSDAFSDAADAAPSASDTPAPSPADAPVRSADQAAAGPPGPTPADPPLTRLPEEAEVPPAERVAFATETMAELLASQGRREDAARLYQQIMERKPEDPGIRERMESVMSSGDSPAVSAEGSTLPMRELLSRILAYTPPGAATVTPPAYHDAQEYVSTGDARAAARSTISGRMAESEQDAERAARTFADAASALADPSAEARIAAAVSSQPEPISAVLARVASESSDASADTAPTRITPRQAPTFSFDQFFRDAMPEEDSPAAPDARDEGAPPTPPEDDEDGFREWLDGLRKS